jgi:hypothetical protein
MATHYSEDLRAIGQTLEARGIAGFELKQVAGVYIINATFEQAFGSKVRPSIFGKHKDVGIQPLLFEPGDLKKLIDVGQSYRGVPGGLTEFRKLSNLLRTIGAYLDSSEFDLVALQKRAISVTLFYRDEDGEEQQEHRAISCFFNDFLDLYRRRG